MDFENGFAETERAVSVATKSATTLISVLRQLQKAAAHGEIDAMRSAAQRVAGIVKTVDQLVENAISAWPFSIESEERYMQDSYVAEFLERAQAESIQVQRLDDGFLAFPSVVRIIPTERSVTIDRRKVRAVRPSQLIRKLKSIQSTKPKLRPEYFLEVLHRTYRLLTDKEYGKTISLADVYEALTLLPGSTATYGRSEFARDLFLLDRSGVTATRSGAKLSLPASTGTKGSKGTFSFVSPDGETVTYYGVHFLEVSK